MNIAKMISIEIKVITADAMPKLFQYLLSLEVD